MRKTMNIIQSILQRLALTGEITDTTATKMLVLSKFPKSLIEPVHRIDNLNPNPLSLSDYLTAIEAEIKLTIHAEHTFENLDNF